MVQKARKEEILQAAIRVFYRKGFHAARIQDVADELGMQKGSLYHYISTKEDLIKGLVAGILEGMIEVTTGILATGHTARQKVGMAIEAHLLRTVEDRENWGILLREDLELLNRNSPAYIRVLVKQYESLWDRIVAEGVASGDFDPNLDQRVAVQEVRHEHHGARPHHLRKATCGLFEFRMKDCDRRTRNIVQSRRCRASS